MFLGVDGGGTKTAFALVDRSGRLLALHQEGGAYYLEIGMEATAALLKSGAAATLAAAGVGADAVQFAFFGLPAHGEDSALLATLDALPSSFMRAERYRCGNDVICGWSGSLGCQDGIGVVAGTGSIAYGEYAGRGARAGGWGELFSDEGSAYWIAREGLRLFSRMSDGRCAKGLLHALVRSRFALKSDLDLCAAIYGATGMQRSALAQLARLVAQAARDGDRQAGAIFAAAAQELVQLVEATRSALAVPDDLVLPVSYSGGVFAGESPRSSEADERNDKAASAPEALLLDQFRTALLNSATPFTFASPIFSPAIGAALYAARCAGMALPAMGLSTLVQQCKLRV